MNIYIYVDDIRDDDSFFKSLPHTKVERWDAIVCRSYNETIDMLKFYRYIADNIIIDLDHDLGDFDVESDGDVNPNAKSGYDICKWIVEHEYPLTAFHLHSMNAVGLANMRQLLTHYNYKEI